MLGVTQMDEKKVLKPIDEMLADPWQVDIINRPGFVI